MLIVVGRSLLFVNMYASKSFFNDLCSHNINQARDRMLEWESGRQLRGSNEWQSFAVSWSDIDYIAVLSIVDGPHAGCLFHNVEELNLSPKVTLCATLTTAVMKEIALKGGGARDLIFFCKSIASMGFFTEEDALRLLEHIYLSYKAAVLQGLPKPDVPTLKPHIPGDQDYRFQMWKTRFEEMRRQTKPGFEVFSDLAWEDVFEAVGFIMASGIMMAPLEHGKIRQRTFGNHTKFSVVVSSTMKGMTENQLSIMDRAVKDGCSFICIVNLLAQTDWGVVVVFSFPTPSATELALAADDLTEFRKFWRQP